MRPNIEKATYFNQVASALKLTQSERNAAWDMMALADVGEEDTAAYHFCTLAKMGSLTAELSDDLKKQIRGLRSNITEDVNKAMPGAMSGVREDFSKSLHDLSARELSTFVEAAKQIVFKEDARRQTFRLSQIALGVALVVGLTFCIGYALGRDQVNSDAARWSSLVNLSDGDKWLSVARLNPDFDKTFAQGCALGQRAVQAGGEKCQPALWVSAPVATSTGTDLVRLSFAEWSNKLGVWGILGLGLVGGFLGGRFWTGRKKSAY